MEEVVHVGIDLGTTNCSVAVYDGENLQICHNNSNKDATPSWISFSNPSQGLIIGEPARNEIKAEHVVYDSKRLIGKRGEEYEEMKSEIEDQWPFEVREKNDLLQMGLTNPLNDDDETNEDDGKEWFYPEEISGYLIRNMMSIASSIADKKKIGKVVVTVPADFEDSQRRATERACKLAGLTNFELLNEPSASILYFKHLYPEKKVKTIVIIDFGGGTLDVTCSIDEEKEIKVKSTGGNQKIGGNDFDNVIVELIKNKLKEAIGENDDDDDEKESVVESLFEESKTKGLSRMTAAGRKQIKKRKMNIKNVAEQVKKDLSERENVQIDLRQIFTEQDIDDYFQNVDINISSEEFEEASEDILDEFEITIKKNIKKSKI